MGEEWQRHHRQIQMVCAKSKEQESMTSLRNGGKLSPAKAQRSGQKKEVYQVIDRSVSHLSFEYSGHFSKFQYYLIFKKQNKIHQQIQREQLHSDSDYF